MALFKILKGTAAKLPSNKVEGYCYVTTDTHKMYIDTSASTRICLNAASADTAGTATKLATSRTISIAGAVTGSGSFDGSANLTITTSVNHTHSYAGSASAGGDANRAVKVKDSSNGNDITITYGKSGQASTSWLASWNNYELGAISPANITAGKATTLATARKIGLTGDVTATGISFDGTANISLTTAMNVNYAGSSSKGGPATAVATTGVATADVARHVWFSDSNTETKRTHDDNFKYNPKTKTLTTSITGSSASCTGNAATATKLATSRSIELKGDITGSANFDGSANIGINSTLTVNYAGSSSKGGAATSANKLNTDAGSATLPVYFTSGVPKAINTTGVGISITGNAATATKLATARKIGNASFDGSANIALSTIGAQPTGNYFKGTKDNENYWGLNTPDGSTSNYIRTSSNGLIPYQSGGIGNGHSYLGTSSWYFYAAYLNDIFSQRLSFNNGSASMTYDTTNQCITFNFA